METINLLKKRFEDNKKRHKDISWSDIEKKLLDNAKLLEIVKSMEETGGEPDLIKYNGKAYFVDCSPESPQGRRSLCYDEPGRKSRKNFKPKDSAVAFAGKIGIEILDEAEYRFLQTLGDFDQKTSSWINTPQTIRGLGGAIFADRRYNTVFIYHSGAESYYASRGFRGKIVVN